MKLKLILILLPLSIFSSNLPAQVEDLMRDKNITWIAETYNDFQFEEAHEKLMGKKLNDVTPLKFMDIQEGNFSEEFVFYEILSETLSNGKTSIYKDENCRKIWQLGKRVDTITIIDPITLKRTLSTALSTLVDIRPQGFPFFRAHQVVFYNSKKAKFGMRTLGIAPMHKNWDYETKDSIPYLPAFWIKPYNLTKKRKLTDNYIAWARRLNYKRGFLLTDIKPDRGEISTKTLKKTGDNMPVGHYLEIVKSNSKVSFYPTSHNSNEFKYSLRDRQLMLSSIDTVLQVYHESFLGLPDEEKYGSRVVIVKTEKTVEDFPRLRLVQNWYWNSKKNRLEIYLVAAAPVEDMYDADMKLKEKYLFTPVPILYRRTAD